MPNLQKVNEEISKGRLWKARDRLQGMLANEPTSLEVLELLAEVYFRMGDWPEAGRYYFLTSRNDDKADLAIGAFKERCGSSACQMLRLLPIRAPLEQYPQAAFARIELLLKECDSWPMPVQIVRENEETLEKEPSWKERMQQKYHIWFERAQEAFIVTIIFGPWMAGFITLSIWLISFFAPSLKGLLIKWIFLK